MQIRSARFFRVSAMPCCSSAHELQANFTEALFLTAFAEAIRLMKVLFELELITSSSISEAVTQTIILIKPSCVPIINNNLKANQV